ncbi:MAG: protein phosphatase 2C domain-containing protein [Verrucomicrobiota bacterium]
MSDPVTPLPPQTIRWTGLSHVGHVRKNNEDAFLGLIFDGKETQYLGKWGENSLNGHDFVFAVSDGMGGANAGEFASKIVVEKATKLLPKGFRSRVSGMDSGFQDLFEELFAESHRALCYLGSIYPECAAMGCTLSLCWFTPEWMYFGHIGDSRIYYFPAQGGMKQITKDDSHVGWLFRTGKISEREARTHPRKNILQKALGAGHQFVDPQVGAIGIQAGDLFLICSDGVIDGLWDKNILQILRDPDPAQKELPYANRLVHEALGKSGKDNTTALVIEVL